MRTARVENELLEGATFHPRELVKNNHVVIPETDDSDLNLGNCCSVIWPWNTDDSCPTTAQGRNKNEHIVNLGKERIFIYDRRYLGMFLIGRNACSEPWRIYRQSIGGKDEADS